MKKIKSNVLPLLLIGLLSSSLFVTGCTTGPKRFDQYDRGRFKAKILIRDRNQGKAQIVNADVRAVNNEKMRVDITSPILTHLASFALRGREFTFFVVPDKLGYKGKAGHSALKPVLNVPISPLLLYNVFFDQAVANKNWSCSEDEKGYLKECRENRGALKIEWVSRDRDKRTVEISHPTMLMQINIYDFDPKAKLTESDFHLEIPKTFRVKQI